ncbi:MAG: acetoacetate decarboxylase family protein [Gammaproteobacteria bacterium]|nr:acetoacetate decarboxylase family protein [Gammaproteobacteria bacterium]
MNDGTPQGTPGDSRNWPMLKIAYPTDSTRVAALLPPGIDPPGEAEVRLTVYHFPVGAEPELGLVVNVTAIHDGMDGEYSLAYAIDQEQAVFISRELWGQPKFLADVRYFRLGNQVEAAVTHKGHTFFEYSGTLAGMDEPGEVTEVNEWWIKCARSVTMRPNEYDYPPRVVHVYAKYRTAFQQSVEGELTLRDSPWDPLATSLPIQGPATARLWWPEFLAREITLAGALDPEGFWRFADTVGGSRFPGQFGGPAPGGAW